MRIFKQWSGEQAETFPFSHHDPFPPGCPQPPSFRVSSERVCGHVSTGVRTFVFQRQTGCHAWSSCLGCVACKVELGFREENVDAGPELP